MCAPDAQRRALWVARRRPGPEWPICRCPGVPACVNNNVLSRFALHCKGALPLMSALLTAEGRMSETHSDTPLVQSTKRSCSSSKNRCVAGACDSAEQPDRQVLLGRQLCNDAVKLPALACLCSGPS